ncbi:class I SAM-dependent DNA methyltransferase [Devosia sp.]|uniref:HsdM family class I SAM-dependent methyltransferase n=1 Tax=Devosia sp. TaxID=1871048 RepID=UPI002732FE3E|nr:N-6 DNA methylase [Devosia sp.]MDP2779278.1 N-6 DNA methylase [Devosia sp.]
MLVDWAAKLGLAPTPMFAQEAHREGDHFVFLDGVNGSFGFTGLPKLDRDPEPRNWAWSCGVLHHVCASDDEVLVHRWDRTEPVAFRRSAVDKQLDRFYEVLVQEQSSVSLTVTDHAVDAFRRLRSHFPEDRGEQALSVYLLLMSAMISGNDSDVFEKSEQLSQRFMLDARTPAYLAGLSADFVAHLFDGFRRPLFPRSLELVTIPSLLLRHAGAMVFQEAHLETLSTGRFDIFGVPDAASLKGSPANGVHYTPPGLARALAEQALHSYGPLGDEITILDPACGSSSILHELLRILRDRRYAGRIRLHGIDVSHNAVRMSRFFLAATCLDWPELKVVSFDIVQRDALDDQQWPASDITIMNPPFVSLRSLSDKQRDAVRSVLGEFDKGRPDMSMAFVERALSSVNSGGVVASLLPAGVLSMTQGKDWRDHLLDKATVSFIAGFGEVGLFRMATVEIGALVLKKADAGKDGVYNSLWVGEKRDATSQALRFLRRSNRLGVGGAEQERWSIDRLSIAELKASVDWRPRPRFLQRELSRFSGSSPSTVGDLFNVRQGALPAPRSAFMVGRDEFAELPEDERRWFRPVAENDNLRGGQILPGTFIFFSRTAGLPPIESEFDLERECPKFYRRLLTFKDQLKQRRGKAERWWELGEDRSWLREPALKIVTAYFGQAGSFAVDIERNHVVVQGYGWTPSWRTALPEGTSTVQVLHAYTAMLNTDVFQKILAEFCPVVGGGQFNLSRRYVTRVPLPDLIARAHQADGDDQVLRDLIAIGESIHRRGLPYSPRAQAEFLTRTLYGFRA